MDHAGVVGEVVILDVQLFDGAGNELDPSRIQAESGFRYDLVGDDVPEPLGIGWAALAGLKAFRRRDGWSQRGTRRGLPAHSGGRIGCCTDVSAPGSGRQ